MDTTDKKTNQIKVYNQIYIQQNTIKKTDRWTRPASSSL